MLSTRTANFPLPFYMLRSELDRLLDDFSAPAPSRVRRNGSPALNVWEDEKGYFVEAECPGISLEDLELFVTGDQLTISGKRESARPDTVTFHRRERANGSFKRLLSFPTEVDSTGVEATLKDGILTIRVPKAESARPRKIEVKVN